MTHEQTKTLRLVVATLTRRMIAAGLGTHCLRTIHIFLSLPRTTFKSGECPSRDRHVEYSMRSLGRLGLVSRQKTVDDIGRVYWLYDYTPQGHALFAPPERPPGTITE